jgi:aspartate aminotransferase
MAGAFYAIGELERLADWIAQHDMLILEDAIFAETEFSETARSARLASVDGMAERVFTVSGGSKAHGLANIRIAWGCGPKTLVDRLNTFVTSTSATTPQVAKLMALAALEVSPDYLALNARECRTRALQVAALVEQVNVALRRRFHRGPEWQAVAVEFPPSAGHSILLNFAGMHALVAPNGYLIADSVDVTRFFLETAKVAFSPGLSVGWDGCRLRCTFGCVGTHLTFGVSRRAELDWVLTATRRYYSRELGQDAFSVAPSMGPPWSMPLVKAPEPDHAASFATGRALIEEAFLRRVLPAMEALFEINRRRDARCDDAGTTRAHSASR